MCGIRKERFGYLQILNIFGLVSLANFWRKVVRRVTLDYVCLLTPQGL